jgi:hypothetical protein
MYGRAEFDLLKLRVLHRSKKSQDRKSKKNHQGQQVGRLKKPKMMKAAETLSIPQLGSARLRKNHMLAVSTICEGYRGSESLVSGISRKWRTFSTLRSKSPPGLPQIASKSLILLP